MPQLFPSLRLFKTKWLGEQHHVSSPVETGYGDITLLSQESYWGTVGQAACEGRKSFALSGTLLFSFSRQSRFLHGYNLAIKQMGPSALIHRLSRPRMLPLLCVQVCMCVWALWSCHMNPRMSHGLQCQLLSQISTLREHKPSEWGRAVLGLYLRIPDTQVFIHPIHSYCPLTESGDCATEQTGTLTCPLRAPSLDGASWSTNS